MNAKSGKGFGILLTPCFCSGSSYLGIFDAFHVGAGINMQCNRSFYFSRPARERKGRENVI
ncbi:MAG: hypothetical protein N2V75_05695 [Methanophagales archaeon]|nr:hypothetical protein [Methanophagales archaeon]